MVSHLSSEQEVKRCHPLFQALSCRVSHSLRLVDKPRARQILRRLRTCVHICRTLGHMWTCAAHNKISSVSQYERKQVIVISRLSMDSCLRRSDTFLVLCQEILFMEQPLLVCYPRYSRLVVPGFDSPTLQLGPSVQLWIPVFTGMTYDRRLSIYCEGYAD